VYPPAGRYRLGSNLRPECGVVRPATLAHDLDLVHRCCNCGSHSGCHIRNRTFDLCHSPQVTGSPVPERGVLCGRLFLIEPRAGLSVGKHGGAARKGAVAFGHI
jgi:hypothetical protein